MAAQTCSQRGCENKVPHERVKAGYDYCMDCSRKNPGLHKRVVQIDMYDPDELRRAW
jgi:hypothetical protein